MNFLDKYFHTHTEYPQEVAVDPLPMNELWSYISSTFLNGFINYVDIKSAFLFNRYQQWDEELTNHHTVRQEGAGQTQYGYDWVKFKGTKGQLYDLVVGNPNAIYHTNISMFEDDVVILAEASRNVYLFFWYDQDCSDCSIGRFITDEPYEEVLKDFKEWATNKEFDGGEAKELPASFFRGWLKG